MEQKGSYSHYHNLPILQMTKLRLRVSKQLICNHSVGLWPSQCLEPLVISSGHLLGPLESSLELGEVLWEGRGRAGRQKSSILQKGAPYPLSFILWRAVCPLSLSSSTSYPRTHVAAALSPPGARCQTPIAGNDLC